MARDAGAGEPAQTVLSRAVRLLSGTPEPALLLGDLASLLVPELGDWCLADLLEPPDLITRVAAVGPDGPLRLPVELGPASARRSSARALGVLTRLADTPGQRLQLSGDQLRAMAASPDRRTRAQGELALSLGAEHVVVLGLVHGGDVLGVLSMGRRAGGFSAAELRDLQDLAALAGLALSNARLSRLQRGVSVALQQSLLPALPVIADDALAAARMAELRNLLRAVAVDQQAGPAQTLARLDAVADRVAPELSGTCLYARLTVGPAAAQLEWSSAGHLPPVLLRNRSAELLDTPADLMLGVRLGTDRADHSRELLPGDLLVLYTDGLVEERHTGLDERFEVLRRLVERLGAEGPELLADRLVSELASGQDDVAVLVVVLDPTPPDPVAAGSTRPGAGS